MKKPAYLSRLLVVFFILFSFIVSASASDSSPDASRFVEPERIPATEFQSMKKNYSQAKLSIAEGIVPYSISKGCMYEVLYNSVNIRSGPGTNYPSYGHLQKGDGLLRTDFNPGQRTDSQGYTWYHLNVMTGINTGVTGWVRGDQIKLIY